MPAILMLSQPINTNTTIPVRHIMLHIMAIREALLGLILSRLTMNPPQTIPKHAPLSKIFLHLNRFKNVMVSCLPGIAIPPK